MWVVKVFNMMNVLVMVDFVWVFGDYYVFVFGDDVDVK